MRFNDVASSSTTQHRMVFGSDGALYAFYHTVGSSTDGGLLRVQPETGVFQTLLTANAVGTRTWEQLLEGSDGMLYAIAGNKLVRVDRNGSGFQVIHTNQTSSFGPSQPDLLLESANGDLYVTETSGGDSLRGVIYRIKKDGSGLVTVALPAPAGTSIPEAFSGSRFRRPRPAFLRT
jgi:hypothetical protein